MSQIKREDIAAVWGSEGHLYCEVNHGNAL